MFKRYQGRTPLAHLKDMTTDEEQFFAELGIGGVAVKAVLEMSMDYLKRKLPSLYLK